jgi:hypothetical protein
VDKNTFHFKEGEYIVIGNKALFFARLSDSSCHLFAEGINEAIDRITKDNPEETIHEISLCVAGHDIEFDGDIDVSEIQWHDFTEIKIIE